MNELLTSARSSKPLTSWYLRLVLVATKPPQARLLSNTGASSLSASSPSALTLGDCALDLSTYMCHSIVSLLPCDTPCLLNVALTYLSLAHRAKYNIDKQCGCQHSATAQQSSQLTIYLVRL